MSQADTPDESTPKKVMRTVTPPYRGRPDPEMDVIGWLYFLGLLVILLPLLPIIVGIWIVSRLLNSLTRKRE